MDWLKDTTGFFLPFQSQFKYDYQSCEIQFELSFSSLTIQKI